MKIMNYQHVAVSAHIVHDSKALIVKRAPDDDFLANYWEQVGGSLDWGEHPTDGLLREVLEESGLHVEMIRPYDVHHYMKEEKGIQIVEVAYLCKIIGSPEVTLSHEHQDFRWVTLEDLDTIEPITNSMRVLIKAGFEAWK